MDVEVTVSPVSGRSLNKVGGPLKNAFAGIHLKVAEPG